MNPQSLQKGSLQVPSCNRGHQDLVGNPFPQTQCSSMHTDQAGRPTTGTEELHFNAGIYAHGSHSSTKVPASSGESRHLQPFSGLGVGKRQGSAGLFRGGLDRASVSASPTTQHYPLLWNSRLFAIRYTKLYM